MPAFKVTTLTLSGPTPPVTAGNAALSRRDLEASDGGRALIASEHLKVVVDYGFYGIPESGVLFHMAEAPSRGRIL